MWNLRRQCSPFVCFAFGRVKDSPGSLVVTVVSTICTEKQIINRGNYRRCFNFSAVESFPSPSAHDSVSSLTCLCRHDHGEKLTESPVQAQVQWVMENKMLGCLQCHPIRGDFLWESRESSSILDTVQCREAEKACRVPAGFIHIYGEGCFGVTTALPLDSSLTSTALSQAWLPLPLSSLLFAFPRRGGSFLGIWCPQTYIKFSIGIFITFSETGAVFLLVY